MDSTMISWDCSSTEGSPQRPTIYSLATMWIEANSHLKLFVYFSLIRSSTLRTSFCSEETMNAQALTEFMGFMMNAREDTTLSFGKLSPIVSTASQSQQLLTKRSYVCMEVSPQNSQTWNRFEESWDQQMSQTPVYCVTFFGQILKKTSKVGRKTIEESVSYSAQTSFQFFWRNTI